LAGNPRASGLISFTLLFPSIPKLCSCQRTIPPKRENRFSSSANEGRLRWRPGRGAGGFMKLRPAGFHLRPPRRWASGGCSLERR